jgi:nitrogen fixation/metabolism regulation signal transduction histidine kinase
MAYDLDNQPSRFMVLIAQDSATFLSEPGRGAAHSQHAALVRADGSVVMERGYDGRTSEMPAPATEALQRTSSDDLPVLIEPGVTEQHRQRVDQACGRFEDTYLYTIREIDRGSHPGPADRPREHG